MKQFILTFLTLLAITPSLACAMTTCPMQSAMAGDAMPCHGDNDTLMLMQDCMGVDFFSQDVSYDIQINQPVDDVDIAWADLTPAYHSEPHQINAIRGPPPRINIAGLQPSIYFTTQRFRI